MRYKPLLLRLLIYAGMLCFILVYKILADSGLGIPCLYTTFFNTQCISCGATRAFYALARLDFSGAFAINPLFTVVVYPAFAIFLIVDLVRVIAKMRKK